MFLPDRYVKGTCPRCNTDEQYGDSCEACGASYHASELKNPVSVVSGATPIQKESEHLFFELPNYADELKQWIIDSISTLLKNYNLNPQFKQPNDIYINNQKICGILFESRTTYKLLDYVVIGIGLNVNQVEFNDLKATSIKKELNTTFDLQILFDELLEILLNTYKI